MKLIKKIARKILFSKKNQKPTKDSCIGGNDLDDKGLPKDEPIIFFTNPTGVNAAPSNIEIKPIDPIDQKISAKSKPKTLDAETKESQVKKPGRPKGSANTKKQAAPIKKNPAPKKK